MSTIKDYCPRGGWLIDNTTVTGGKVMVGDVIVCTAIDDKTADVAVMRGSQATVSGKGTLNGTGNLFVPIPPQALILTRVGNGLSFAWEDGQGGASPDGGGSGGNPGGNG